MLNFAPSHAPFKPGDAASFVAAFFPDAKQRANGQWLVCCPGHDDKQPSLSIAQGDKGIVLKDFAHCEVKTICDRLGIQERDLFTPSERPQPRPVNRRQTARTEYVYHDSQGQPLYRKVRLDFDDESKSIWVERLEAGKWVKGQGDAPHVLYRLPDLHARPLEPVFLVEGEKCCEDLARRGLVSTTSGSADSWRDEFAKFFSGCVVVILPDNDAPGREYARTAARSLSPVASRVIVVNLPGLAEKQDVYDWLRMGHTVDDLETLAANTDPWQPVPAPVIPFPAPAPAPASESNESRPQRFQVIHADELDDMEPVEWLIEDEIAAKQFNLAWGASQGGKSFYGLDRALTIAQSHPVIYVAAEDAQGYAARKIAWCKHHHMGAGQLYFVPQPVNLFDAAVVGDFIEQVARPLSPVLIVFDTLARCMVGADENSNRDMGIVIEHLEWIRRAVGTAVMPVHHSGKDGKTYRGASALYSAAYASIEIAKDDDVITVTCDKAKNTEEFKPRRFRLVQVQTGRTLRDGQAETSCVFLPSDQVDDSQDTTLRGTQRRLLETLALETFVSTGAKASTVGSMLGLKDANLYKSLAGLLKRGYIRQASKGDPYYITDTGLVALVGSVADKKDSTLLYSPPKVE